MKKSFTSAYVIISSSLSLTLLDNYSYAVVLNPVTDGSYYSQECCVCSMGGCDNCATMDGIIDGIIVESDTRTIISCLPNVQNSTGIIEFDISSLAGLFTSGHIEATLSLRVKDGNVASDKCLFLYSIEDYWENGVISHVDINTQEFIKEICVSLQPGEIITFDVTTAVEHDLFDSDQTDFSGFVVNRSTDWSGLIEFYDHTDLVSAPQLNVIDSYSDFDEDGIPYVDDNCPETPNPLQEDTSPPQGNGIGDACDCESDFDCNGAVDADDVTAFVGDFGRNIFCCPCTNLDQCNGDSNCDGNVDALDVYKFLEDFGRSQYNNPCPACVAGDWCVYP